MRLRTLGLAALLAAGTFSTGGAVVRKKGAEGPVVANGRAPRAHRTTAWASPADLATAGFAGWRAIYDHDTNVPLRLWGPGQLASGTVGDPATADRWARDFLAAHLASLAPGAAAADFVVVANELSPDGEVRSVGFQQRASGMTVLGGSIGFAFKRDRMIMVSSTALPHVAASMTPAPATRLARATVEASAMTWLAAAGRTVAPRAQPAPMMAHATTQPASPGDRVIVPIVRPRVGAAPDITYRVAEQTTLQATAGEAGLWTVWLDAASGAPIARATGLSFNTGTVLYNTPDRSPSFGPRTDKPAPFANLTINGSAVQTTAAGVATWTSGDASVTTTTAGLYAKVQNQAGANITAALTMPNNGSVAWNQSTSSNNDAQVDSYIFANQVKAFARAKLNPTLAWLDSQLPVRVNINDTCNAFSDGNAVNFFIADNHCENTGRMADVVYHEFGHSMHNNSIIEGVGAFDSSLSEGLADTMSQSITGDSGLGRGFFFSTEPLRELNPAVKKVWPDDADGEPHDEGEIIGETLWDTRAILQQHLGTEAGYAQFLKIYYSVMQRSVDIPSSYAEALVGDDDDGSIANGTPNMCDINAAFGAHGLADPSVTLGLAPPSRNDFTITVTSQPGSDIPQCPGAPTISGAKVTWRVRGGSPAVIDLTQNGTDYTGMIPTQTDGTVVEYKVEVNLTNSQKIVYPNNPADPYYQFYVGNVTKIWCADFESGSSDWTHGASPASSDYWESGMPLGLGGDPRGAHGGAKVFGLDLTNGVYDPNMTTYAESPEIDLQGNTQVRLQYWRWLGVEDGFYDQAKIEANGAPVWSNFASATDPQFDETNHVDREWRFQDIDLSAHTGTGKLKLRFDLTSDPGLEFGGWTIDDVCIVTAAAAGPGTCGDGHMDAGEECDDGNTTAGDGCSATCTDEGTGSNGDGDSDSGGCCSTGGSSPTGALLLGGVVLGFSLRRRRK